MDIMLQLVIPPLMDIMFQLAMWLAGAWFIWIIVDGKFLGGRKKAEPIGPVTTRLDHDYIPPPDAPIDWVCNPNDTENGMFASAVYTTGTHRCGIRNWNGIIYDTANRCRKYGQLLEYVPHRTDYENGRRYPYQPFDPSDPHARERLNKIREDWYLIKSGQTRMRANSL